MHQPVTRPFLEEQAPHCSSNYISFAVDINIIHIIKYDTFVQKYWITPSLTVKTIKNKCRQLIICKIKIFTIHQLRLPRLTV